MTHSSNSEAAWLSWLHLPDHWPSHTEMLEWCQTMTTGAATLLILGGLVFLLFGVYAFRPLMTLNAAVMGAVIGAIVGEKAGIAAIGAVVGGVLVGAMAWPLMKYSVAGMGGIYGALIGAGVWRGVGLEAHLAWAGALIGLILFGLLAFIVFRTSVMMYTSLQGGAMLIFGTLGLLYKHQSFAPYLTQNMGVKPFLLPLAISIPAILGIVYQQTQFPPKEAKGKKTSLQ
ncbi:MAG: hypothetical protein ACREJC_20710 [Tepidisphaeraceae bacterium]